MSDQGSRFAAHQPPADRPRPDRRRGGTVRRASARRDRFAYRPGNGLGLVEQLEDRQLLSSDLTSDISGLIGQGTLKGSHTFTNVTLGSFLTIPSATVSLNLTQGADSLYTGTVSVDATSASFGLDSAVTGSITAQPNSTTDALTGSYTLNDVAAGQGKYSLAAQDFKLAIGSAFTAEATPVAITYDPNGSSHQQLVAIGSATATFLPLNGATAAISDLTVDEDGFTLGDASVTSSAINLGGILTASSPTIGFSNVSDSNGTLSGTIQVGAKSASILASQSALSAGGNGLNLTGFSGSYTLPADTLAIAATGAELDLGKLVDATASGVTLGYNPNAPSPVTVGVQSLTATSPLLPGVTGTITNLQASSAGLSFADATLSDANTLNLGSVFQVSGASVSVTGFSDTTSNGTLLGTVGISTTGAALFPGQSVFNASVSNFGGTYALSTGALALSAGEVDLNFGQVLKVDATKVAVNWDGTNASFGLGGATLSSPEFPGFSGSLSAVTVDSSGFVIGSAQFTDKNNLSLGSVITLVGPTTITATNLDYTRISTSSGSLSGTIGLSFGGLQVLPGSSVFSTTVTPPSGSTGPALSGSYNLATQATTLSVNGTIVITVGSSMGDPVLTVTASQVGIALTPNSGGTDDSVDIEVGSATASLNKFAGLNGNVTGLSITNDGFSVGSATLSAGGTTPGSNGKGTLSAFGGKFQVVDPSVTLTNFGYSMATGKFTEGGSLTLSADEFDFNQGGTASVKAVGAPGLPITASISFATSDVGHTIITVPTAGLMTIQLGTSKNGASLILTGSGITIDTAPAQGGDFAQFASLSATLKVGSLNVTGSASDFAIDANGNLVAGTLTDSKGNLIPVGVDFSSNASSNSGSTSSGLAWPSWLPIQVTTLGVSWPNGFAADPTAFDLTLSASVNASFAGGKFALGGNVTDAVFDTSLLAQGAFPIISLAGAGLSVTGSLGGATVSGSAFVAIANLDASGTVIPDGSSTAVARRIFYGGIIGSLQIGSAGGVTIYVGLSQLGPLDLDVEFNDPGEPIVLDPESGLAISEINGGIEFDTQLTAPSSAKALATSLSSLFTGVDLTTWEKQLAQQVASQASSGNASYDAFAQPFVISAGVTLTDEYLTSNGFTLNGQVEIDTTGKLLIAGKLTLGGSSSPVTIQAGAFIDLSKVAQGKAQLLWSFQAPASAPILSLYGAVQITVTNPNSPQEVLAIAISGEADLTLPEVQGGIQLVGSAKFVDTASSGLLDISLDGTASLAPLGQFGELAGHADLSFKGSTPQIYGAFYAQVNTTAIPELNSLGLTINAQGFVEFNTTSTAINQFPVTLPNNGPTTTYNIPANSVTLYIPNATLSFKDVFAINANLYASFELVPPASGKGQDQADLDVCFSGMIGVGPVNSNGTRAFNLSTSGVLIINSSGLAAQLNVSANAGLTDVKIVAALALQMNTTGQTQSFTVPLLPDPNSAADGTPYLPGSGTTYSVPGTYTISGTTTSGPYLVVTGNGDVTVGSGSKSQIELEGNFDVLVSPSLFRLDINSMKVDILSFTLIAQGGLVISSSGIVGAISVSAGTGVSGPGNFYSLNGTFLFDVNTTSTAATVGSIPVPADSAEVAISGDLKVGDPGAGQFDITATISILVDSSGVTLSLYGTASLGSLGTLSVGSMAIPSTLTISSSGLKGDLTLSGTLKPISGTELMGSITLDFDTSAGLFMLAVGSDALGNPAQLIIANGAVDLKGYFDLTISPAGFLIDAGFNLSIMGASLASGSFDAAIYTDADGSPELALYAGLSLNSQFASGLISFTASPSLAINTGHTSQLFPDGNSAPAQTASFRLANASVNVFGFHASGSLIATISSSGFDIMIPQSNPLKLSFLGLGSMEVYGFIDSDGRFSITGQVGYDVNAGPFELYGGLGATIASTGFSAWFYGGANLDCGALGTVHLASISAMITVMTDHMEISAHVKVLGIGFSFDESLGSYSPPAHSPGLFAYNAPTVAVAGSVTNLSSIVYDPSNNALPADGDYDEWDVTGPPDVLNGNQPYFAVSNSPIFSPTLGGAGTYTVSLYEVGPGLRTLLKQSTINVILVAPTINSLNLEPSYLSSGTSTTTSLSPILTSTNEALLEPANYDPINNPLPSQTTVPTSGSYWAVTENNQTLYYPGLYPNNVVLQPVNQYSTIAPVYIATLYIRDPYNGNVTASGSFHMFDIYNLTVNDPGDEEVTGGAINGNYDIVPANGLLTLRRAIDIINDNADYQSHKVATIRFAPSLAGSTILLSQEEFFDHGGYDRYGNPTPDIGSSDFGIEYPMVIDGSAAPGLTIANAAGSTRRLFFVGHNTSANTTLSPVTFTLENLTIQGGNASGFYNASNGGAIYVTDQSKVTVDHVALLNNQANGLVNTNDIVSNDGQGGAVFIDVDASFTAIDSTFSGNSVTGSPTYYNQTHLIPGGNGYGGAIYDNNGTLSLVSDTIVKNLAAGVNLNGGVYIYGDDHPLSVGIFDTIIAGNSGGYDLDNSFDTTAAYNIIPASSGNLTQTFKGYFPTGSLGITGVDPKLGKLVARGDLALPIYSLLPGSPAIGAGKVSVLSSGETTDGRGLSRELNGLVDIGAYEQQSYVVDVNNGNGPGTIYQAVRTDDDNSTIVFASSIAGISTEYTPAGSSTPVVLGPIVISSNLTIAGPGAGLLKINGGNQTELFKVVAGVTATISGLTLSGGHAVNKGGAIDNFGHLTLINDLLTGNTVVSFSDQIQANGGAIYDEPGSSLTLIGDTFVSNLAVGGNSSHNANIADGGAIYSGTGTTITGNDDTFSGNVAQGGAYILGTQTYNSQGYGGAIFSGGSTTLTNVTFANNSAQTVGPGLPLNTGNMPLSNGADLWVVAGTVTLNNSIAANPVSGVDIDNQGGTISGSNNLVMSSVNMPAAEIVSTADPKLRALGNYGGPTPTLELIDGSPAINAALASAAPALDQRGIAYQGDLGAFQLRHGFTVTNTNDSGMGSLRQILIDDIDQTPIGFATSLAGKTINLTTGPILLGHDIQIDGSAATGLSISGGSIQQIFLIGSGANVIIDDLTLRQGQGSLGGAINNGGNLTLVNDTLSTNIARGGTINSSNAGLGAGGAIYDAPGSTLNATGSTFSNNSAIGGSGFITFAFGQIDGDGGVGRGGAIDNEAGAIVNLIDDTFANNLAIGGQAFHTGFLSPYIGNGGSGFGGGLINYGTAKLTNDTFAMEAAQAGSGVSNGTFQAADVLNSGSLAIVNTILANSQGGVDFYNNGTLVTGSNNFAMTSTGVPAGVIASTADPLLMALGNYGGLTSTFALQPMSAVLGAGLTSVAPSIDQRGQPRQVGGAVDIGSYETQAIPVIASTSGPYTGYYGQTLQLDASSTQNPSGSRLSYNWTITNAQNSILTSGVLPVLNLASLPAGLYSVVLTVSDGYAGNHVVTATTTLTVLPALAVSSIVPASTAPAINTTFDTAAITFDYPVAPGTLNAASVSLSLNGGPNLLKAANFPTGAVSGTPNTYQISGLAAIMALNGQGSYTLTVNASNVVGLASGVGYGLGSLSASWDYDTTAPTSLVQPLPTTATGTTFVVTVAGTDPSPAPRVPASGVASYDILVSVDGGPFGSWTNVSASSPSATYTGSGGHSYAFQSFAHDLAGNVESKPAVVEAATYVPFKQAPGVHVTSVNTSSQLFTIQLGGSAANGGVLDHVDVLVSIDGEPFRPIAKVAGASSTVTFEAIADGTVHQYAFYAVGTDTAGNVQTPPAGPSYDDLVSARFASPTANVPVSLSVDHGAAGRSFVGSVDLAFDNPAGLASLISGGHVHLIKHALDGTGSTPISVAGLLSVVDNAIEFNFGTQGLGGSPDSTAGDGYYEIDIDGIAQAFHFDRLFGDVNGDGTVDTIDASLITGSLGLSIPGSLINLDGTGAVTTQARLSALRARGNHLVSGLHLDA